MGTTKKDQGVGGKHMTTLEEFNGWLKRPEGISLEFKEAKNSFDKKHDLPDYCAALANEGGGKLLLGVSNDGAVKGTKAFTGTHNKLSHELFNALKIRIDIEELLHPNGRVLIFHVPPRPKGLRIKSTGNYTFPMRMGESLSEMDDITTKRILNETEPDFSCQIATGISLDDLDGTAIQKLRTLCFEKSKNLNYLERPAEQFLADLGLKTDAGINHAALILLGKKDALDKYLPNAEIVFEWRQIPGKTPYDYRNNWREPFFNVFDNIWDEIDKRNMRTPYREGFIQKEILSFDKDSIREAILNAVAHRDYTLGGQVVFIKASPESFVIESPGGFLPGITPENAIDKSSWRNQRMAETLERAGLIERSGQGLDIIYEKTIRDGKGKPDLSRSDAYSVTLEIPAAVKDSNFILFLEKVANEKQITFSFDEILELEKIREQLIILGPEHKNRFLSLGIIEKVGKTRGAKYILSHKYYVHEGKPGIHTRLTGLSRDEKKALILTHLKKNEKGFPKDFSDAFPNLKTKDISNLLQELRREGKIDHFGPNRGGYWALKNNN